MTKVKGDVKNEHGLIDDLGFGDCDFDSLAIAGFSNEDFGDLDIADNGSASVQHAGLGISHFDESPSGLDFELTEAESAIVRLVEGKIAGSRGRVASAKSEKIYITHEDFDEGPERDAFLLIYGYAEHLFDGQVKSTFKCDDLKKRKALNFFFCRSPNELNFEDAVACIDNQIRLDVLRLRFMFEFWIRDWKLPALPEEADGLPSRVELAAAQYEAMIGVALAREAWFEPGIEAGALLERVVGTKSAEFAEQTKTAFKDMVLNYVLSISEGKVYTTGKNPVLELADKQNDPTVRVRGQLANIYWSRRF